MTVARVGTGKNDKDEAMARMARRNILFDGCYAHVFTRSIEKRKVFKDKEDFHFFISALKAVKKENPFQIYYYCLMQTHFHMAVGVDKLEDFSFAMQKLKWKYTRYFNKKHKRWGPLWRERFKSMLIEDERYLCACGQYIHYNPVKSGMVDDEKCWPYSSTRHYQGQAGDDMIDGYEQKGFPEEIDMGNPLEFTSGNIIGSAWFKFKTKRGWVSPKR